MSCKVKYIKLKRSDNYGFGFSVLGGAGSELPPLVYDVIEGSPASNSNQLSPGDIILEINGQEVLNFTTKEVLNCLRLSTREVILKLKSDTALKEKVHHLRQTPNNSEILRNAITQDDLQGVKEIVAKKSEAKNEDALKSLSPKKDLPKESTSISSLSSSSSSEHNDKVESNKYTVCQQEKTNKSESNILAGDLTLDFSRASQNSDFLLSQKLINNVKKSTSMPTSPNDKDKGLDCLSKSDNHDFGSPQSLCSPLPPNENGACSSFIYPPSTTLVRISKSEDYLQHQKDNMSSVNIELDDDVTSSLNTLLDTRDDDPYPVCSSGAAVNSCALNNIINNDEVESVTTVRSANAPLTSSSPPDSIGHSSHDSDSPLIHSLTPVSPQSPTSSMQYSCSGMYNKMCSARDSLGSSNRSENVCSNSSSLTSPDTDVPDELEWDDTTPTFSPTNHNQIVNGFSDKNATLGVPSMNGHLGRTCSPTDSSMSENMVQKIDENRIIIKVAGPEKIKKKKHSSHRKPSSQDKEAAVNGDPDRTPTNTPPQTPGSGTLSPETLAYQQLWESEDEITCLSEKSDESSSCASANKRPTSATSPPLSEDESDIESLHSFHYSPKAVDIPSAVRLAKRLFALDGFKKSDVSRHLSKNNEFSKAVAEEYLRYFNFSKDTLDIALRKFLDKFCLSGETQERERVLVHFSKRYLDCNPGQFNSQDAVHTLTCALMLLNTDLHNQNIGRKMTCSEFIDNLAELNDGENFQPEILRALYYAIKSEPLKWAADDGDESSKVAGQGLLEEAHRVIGSNPFLSTPIGSGVIYKKGYIMRKCCVEPSGKRTAFGKRSWKMWFCVIQDLVLYLHKDEQGARRGPPPQMGQNAVRLHHALAQKALDYSKKEHVFRLQTADQAEYLLQTSDSKELQAWIDAINFVAASLSAPPMPGAVGSQKKFQRPLLPCSITKLNVVEQLEDHSARVNQIESELNDLKTNPLDKNAKSATVSSHKEKLAYLTSELRRYQTYVHLLRSRLESSSGVSKVMVGGVVNPLPVFDGVEVKEVGPEEAGDPSSGGGIVPPPIPERSTRHADSDDGENFQDRGMQTSDGSNKFLGRNKKDEFQKELEKMIKEKEKKDKKREKIEKKEQADTLKRKTREQKNMTNENHKDNDNKDNKDNDNKNEENRKEIECQEDPRMGTFARVSALFKFSKLNRPNQRRTLYNEEGTEKLDNDQSLKDNSKPDNDIASFPPSKVDNDIATFPSEHIENKTYPTPPPLPPKPGPNSPIMKNLGTRVINV